MSEPLKVLRLDVRAVLPKLAHPGEDNAYDICSCEPAVIEPGKVTSVGTGFAAAQKGFGFLMIGRSSSTGGNLIVLPGLIDAGYRGEWHISLTTFGNPIVILSGERIAQVIPLPVTTTRVLEVLTKRQLGPSLRGNKGFGSSGQ